VTTGFDQRVDSTELDIVPALWGVIHLAVAGVNTVVTVVVINDQVAR
jgi:hypothetical protein